MVYSAEDTHQIERLIRISKEKPLMPETFIPWDEVEQEDHVFLPEKLVSLVGLPVYETLSAAQKRELARREVTQAIYAYCWSEGLFSVFMTRYIQDLMPDDLERRFLLCEIIEESRHQEMFAATILKLNRKPIPVTGFQRRLGGFISCLTVEMLADRYGEHLRQEAGVFPVLQKVSQLHNIEEARHIIFTKALLKRYTENAGLLRRSWYSILVLINVRFFLGTYVRTEIYRDIGLPNPGQVFRQAFPHYRNKFAQECLGTVREFVDSFQGYNVLTRPLWKWVMKM